MIFDISDAAFRNIMQNENLYLPVRWDGNDFSKSLRALYTEYLTSIENVYGYSYYNQKNLYKLVKRVCDLIDKCVQHYLNGLPAKAYNSFAKLMTVLQQTPLKVYKKSCYELLGGDDKLDLFRVACVEDNIPYGRPRIFHTPYTLRSRVSTARYSIAGFPSLYLGTNLTLCCEEAQYNPHKGFAIASKFKFERNIAYNETDINVIELSLKPQDFSEEYRHNDLNRRKFDELDLRDPYVQSAYLLWYPLIAACSFIRTNKSFPFAAEYIIPQLLMQWVRVEMSKKRQASYDRLIGIRYFSCASVKASDMGFNYVFPVSGKQISPQFPYCPVLAKAFRFTKPHFINEYDSIAYCEQALQKDTAVDFLDK